MTHITAFAFVVALLYALSTLLGIWSIISLEEGLFGHRMERSYHLSLSVLLLGTSWAMFYLLSLLR